MCHSSLCVFLCVFSPGVFFVSSALDVIIFAFGPHFPLRPNFFVILCHFQRMIFFFGIGMFLKLREPFFIMWYVSKITESMFFFLHMLIASGSQNMPKIGFSFFYFYFFCFFKCVSNVFFPGRSPLESFSYTPPPPCAATGRASSSGLALVGSAAREVNPAAMAAASYRLTAPWRPRAARPFSAQVRGGLRHC